MSEELVSPSPIKILRKGQHQTIKSFKERCCQGRSISAAEVVWLRDWVEEHRQSSRHRLAMELCRQWHWETATGRLKNFAARSFLSLSLKDFKEGTAPHRGCFAAKPLDYPGNGADEARTARASLSSASSRDHASAELAEVIRSQSRLRPR